MRLTCPACQAETSLDAAIGREADARALGAFISGNVPLGALLISYIALFRPAKRRLSLARTVGLFEELQPDLQRAAITRKGRDWAAPAEVWRAAIDQVLAARDKGTLTLPLTGHGLLYEVLSSLADKAEARSEAEAEADRKARRLSGPSTGPRDLSTVAGDLGAAPGALPPPVAPGYAPYTGPSRGAREIKARIDAALKARQAAGLPAAETTTGADA